MAGEGGGPGEGSVPAQNQQGLDVFPFENVDGLFLGRLLFELQATAGGKNGAGIADPSADFHGSERHEFLVKDALVAVLNSHHLDTQADPGPDDGPDSWIHAGGVTPGSKDADAFEHGVFIMAEGP